MVLVYTNAQTLVYIIVLSLVYSGAKVLVFIETGKILACFLAFFEGICQKLLVVGSFELQKYG